MIRLRRSRRLRAVVGGLVLGAGGLLLAGPRVWAQTQGSDGCAQFATFTALGAADAVQTVQSAPGATLVDTVDAELPGAQAELDSLAGSTGWAGAPYSSTVAGNVGNANVSPNQVPVFATSSYPTAPTAEQSTPDVTIEAKSGADSSSAEAAGGGPSSGPASAGRVRTSAAASCAADGTLHAVGDSEVDGFEVAGVLRVGAVVSHAEATTAPGGRPAFKGSMSVEGATVLGQPVSINSHGLTVGGTSTALPANPLSQSLAAAGINVTYISETENADTGQVIAPGLEVQVTRQVQGLGTGPVTSTYVLGQAQAVAMSSGGSAPSALPPPVSPSGLSPVPSVPAVVPPAAATAGPGPTVAAASAGATIPSAPALGATATPATTAPPTTGAPAVTEPVSYLANASWLSVYGTLGAGALVLIGAAILFGATGVKLRWR